MVVWQDNYIYQKLHFPYAEVQPGEGIMHGDTIDDDLVSAWTIRARLAHAEQHAFIPDQPANDRKAPTADSTGCVILRTVNDILSVYRIHGGARLLHVAGDDWPDSVA